MNNIDLYDAIKSKRVYIVEAYGSLDVWSEELDEPIGCVPSRDKFDSLARAAGWIPVKSSKMNRSASYGL